MDKLNQENIQWVNSIKKNGQEKQLLKQSTSNCMHSLCACTFVEHSALWMPVSIQSSDHNHHRRGPPGHWGGGDFGSAGKKAPCLMSGFLTLVQTPADMHLSQHSTAVRNSWKGMPTKISLSFCYCLMRVSSKFYVLWSSSYIVCQVVCLSIIFLCLMRVSSVFIFSVGIFVHC